MVNLKIYRMRIFPLEVKIFMNIQLDVICTDMVDFRRLSHIYVAIMLSIMA